MFDEASVRPSQERLGLETVKQTLSSTSGINYETEL